MKHTMENEFRNGLIGHRVEVKVDSESPLQILIIIDKVNQWEIGDNPDGCRFAVQSDVFMVMDEAGVVDRIAPHTIVRVIRPQKEVVMPAEQPYSIDTLDDRFRLCKEILLPNCYTYQWITESADGEGYIIWKDGETAYIDQRGVYLRSNGIFVPLNEWVKNPTIESLKPKD